MNNLNYKFPLDKLSLMLRALRQTMILFAEKFTNFLDLSVIADSFPAARNIYPAGIIMSKTLDFYANFPAYLFCNFCNENLRNHLVVRNFIARSTESFELPQSAPAPVFL